MAWLLMGVVTLVVSVAMALEVRGALDREREFRAAPACASVPVKASGCRWEQEFTVRKADLNRGKRNRPPEAELLPPSGKPWDVTFRQTDPVLSEMAAGEKVVGLIWHGHVVEVRDADGRRQQTSHGPMGRAEDRLGGALACFAFGLPALAGGAWPLFARGDRRHAKAGVVVRWHGVCMAVAALFTLWAQAANGWPFWAVPAIWGPLALLGLASMTAFVIAALRGDMDDEAPPAPEPGPTATASGRGQPLSP
ncbi:hypothetical protein [Streptomyces caelestis]|uniref:Uncharacterized protein n=1 Tax=Streptomyces caelestis TaxID=36816 RepID=A0A7W9HAM8_9ACTN|nr:hypothetical protein [Streptomyces caelestis]MBB5798471.1 hypothetical protein [Streptomyces caelestis]